MVEKFKSLIFLSFLFQNHLIFPSVSSRFSVDDFHRVKIEKEGVKKYYSEIEEDFYFVLEEIKTEKQLEFWGIFLEAAMTEVRKKIFERGEDTLFYNSVLASLVFYKHLFEGWKVNNVSVCYAYHRKPEEITPDPGLIEMSFALSTRKSFPYQIHLGICRNILMKEDLEEHERISLALHGFAASIGDLEGRDYMITAPLQKMGELLRSKLSEGSYQVLSTKDLLKKKSWLKDNKISDSYMIILPDGSPVEITKTAYDPYLALPGGNKSFPYHVIHLPALYKGELEPNALSPLSSLPLELSSLPLEIE